MKDDSAHSISSEVRVEERTLSENRSSRTFVATWSGGEATGRVVVSVNGESAGSCAIGATLNGLSEDELDQLAKKAQQEAAKKRWEAEGGRPPSRA